MDVLAAFRKGAPETPVILITAFGDVTGAMAAIQQGAHDYVSKPFNVEELTLTVRRALERSRLVDEERARKGQGGAEPTTRLEEIVGRSPVMLEVYKLVARVAATQSTVLVFGESGTGKELVARAIHTNSPRRERALRRGQLHRAHRVAARERAVRPRRRAPSPAPCATKRGLFEEAQGGTLFLDEIGDVGGKMQAQLLRVLQEGEIRRVGGSESRSRSTCASSRRPTATSRTRCARGASARTSTSASTWSPCACRRCASAARTCRSWSSTSSRSTPRASSAQTAGVAPEAIEALAALSLAGQRARAGERDRARAGAVEGRRDARRPICRRDRARQSRAVPPPGLVDDRPTLAELERRYIELILRETGGNKKRAAEILGIDRRTLYRTLDREEKGERAEKGGEKGERDDEESET